MARPRHPDKHIEAAIQYAEANGWSYQESGGSCHAWGRLKCDRGHADHQFSVWSTPKHPQDFAKRIRKLVDRCRADDGERPGGDE